MRVVAVAVAAVGTALLLALAAGTVVLLARGRLVPPATPAATLP